MPKVFNSTNSNTEACVTLALLAMWVSPDLVKARDKKADTDIWAVGKQGKSLMVIRPVTSGVVGDAEVLKGVGVGVGRHGQRGHQQGHAWQHRHCHPHAAAVELFMLTMPRVPRHGFRS